MKIYEIGTGYTSIPAQVPAATESVVEELTKAFLKEQIDVEIIDICSLNRATNNLPITEVKVPSIFTKSDVGLGIVHKLKRIVYSMALAKKFKKILKAEKERVILHFHNQYNLFFFLKLVSKKIRCKATIAYTNHNGLWSLPWENVNKTLHKKYFQEIYAMKNSDIIFVLNKNSQKNICENLNIAENKIIKIDNGVNTDIYHPLEKEYKDKIKSEYGLNGKKVILQVGSINENKGQDRAIKLLSPLLEKNKNIVYAFVGDIVSKEYYEKIQADIALLNIQDRVKYLGTVSPGKDINEVYNIADFTIFLSNYEGFPLVCIESLAAGTPVIICNNKALNFGEGCLVCSSENLLGSISELIHNDNEQYISLCNQARNTAENQYSWEKVSKNYLEYFLNLQ